VKLIRGERPKQFPLASLNYTTQQCPGLFSIRSGKCDKDEQERLKAAVVLVPSFPESYRLLAACYCQLGRHEEALEEFDHYESLYGQSVHWFRGYLLSSAGQRELARSV
jgi:hypothetical protein